MILMTNLSYQMGVSHVHRVPNQDDSAKSHRDRHGPALQQDGGRIYPGDRVLLR
jgi:hypothetical protein